MENNEIKQFKRELQCEVLRLLSSKRATAPMRSGTMIISNNMFRYLLLDLNVAGRYKENHAIRNFFAVDRRYLNQHEMLTVEPGSFRVKVFRSRWIRYLDEHLVEHAIRPAPKFGFIFRVQTVLP